MRTLFFLPAFRLASLFLLVLLLLTLPAARLSAQNTPSARPYTAPLYAPEWSAPTPHPDRLVLTLSGDPATSFSVTWRTDTTITASYAEIAEATPAPNFWLTARRLSARTEPLDAREIQRAERAAHYHSATFTGLQPNTLYAYRVGDGQRWSEWTQTRTASDQPEPFSFLYVGDAQNQILELWSRLIREGFRTQPDARFILHAGDLINRAHSDSEWHEWFQAGSFIHSMVPSIPLPGNHEYDRYQDGEGERRLSVQWRPQFTLPENGPAGLERLRETAYYMDYQGVRLVVLNSNLLHEEQALWLDQVLADNPNPWTLLSFHHPVYSASIRRDNPELRALWKPVIDRHGVDLVLQGHDHSYARGTDRQPGPDAPTPVGRVNVVDGVNMRDASASSGDSSSAASGASDSTGTVYVVSVSGAKMYNLRPNGWEDFEATRIRGAENTQLFQRISVSGDTLRYESYTATRELYDAFTLIKGANGRNRIIEHSPLPPEYRLGEP